MLLTAQAFTSLTVLSLIGTPLMVFIQILPQVMAAVGCFTRVQEFLTSESREDHRTFFETSSATSQPYLQPESEGDDVELTNFGERKLNDGPTISITDGNFGWKEDADPVLHDINIQIQRASLAMIVGPVGSGKSTLLKALLGETKTSAGSVYLSSPKVAFSDQIPWLMNDTIKKNIIGCTEFDSNWYETVIDACALRKDIDNLPNGDGYVLGSNGDAMSGGQKQRMVSPNLKFQISNSS